LASYSKKKKKLSHFQASANAQFEVNAWLSSTSGLEQFYVKL